MLARRNLPKQYCLRRQFYLVSHYRRRSNMLRFSRVPTLEGKHHHIQEVHKLDLVALQHPPRVHYLNLNFLD
jgi:hypothetical protein